MCMRRQNVKCIEYGFKIMSHLSASRHPRVLCRDKQDVICVLVRKKKL